MMTNSEADELANDLRAINVDVQAATHNEATGGWEIYCWCPDPPHLYSITGAKRSREEVHLG